MSFKYICKECEEDPCILEIAMEADINPFECPFANCNEPKWVKYQPEPDKEKLDLIEALMDMCNQHCIHLNKKDDTIFHGGLSANEDALNLLEKFKFAGNLGKGNYKLLWNKLNQLEVKK